MSVRIVVASVLACLVLGTAPVAYGQECSTSGTGTVLGKAAAGLAPGQWCKLSPAANQAIVLGNTKGSSNAIFGYSHTMAWDSVQKRGFYMGGDHGPWPPSKPRFVWYDDATHSWTHGTLPTILDTVPPPGAYHGYDHSTLKAGSEFFWDLIFQGQYLVFRYNFATQKWSQTSDANAILFKGRGYVQTNAFEGLAYFPERNSIVWASPASIANSNLIEYRLATNSWHVIPTPWPWNYIAAYAEHNPVHGWMLLTSGTDLWKLDAAGRVTKFNTVAPIRTWSGSNEAIQAIDPVSGQFIVMRGHDGSGPPSPGSVYSWDVTMNLWRQVRNVAPPPLPSWHTPHGTFGTVIMPIATYGVIAVVSTSAMWIYKHDPSAGTVLGPTIKLTANPRLVTTGEKTTLAWSVTNASSCVAGGAWSGPRSPSGTEQSSTLVADATFTLTCDGPAGTATETVPVENSNCAVLPPDNTGVIHVGPKRTYKKPSEAAAALNAGKIPEGAVIDIDACNYRDSSMWTKSVTLRGFGGKARLRGDDGQPLANGKALVLLSNFTAAKTWVLEDLEIANATGSDGTGVRAEGAPNLLPNVTLRRLHVHHNGEHGVSGVYQTLLMEHSELGYNAGSCHAFGQCHNVYLFNVPTGHTQPVTATFQHNYSHHAIGGHNLKIRNNGATAPATNYVLYNRLMDESTGNSSYAIDMETGGTFYVIGNLLEVGPKNANQEGGTSFIVNYGTGIGGPAGPHRLLFVNNTLVNDTRSGAVFLRANLADVLQIINNVWVGPKFTGARVSGCPTCVMIEAGLYAPPAPAPVLLTNVTLAFSDLADTAAYDYRPKSGTAAIDAGTSPGGFDGFSLVPIWQYVHPASREPRAPSGLIDAGAYETGFETR